MNECPSEERNAIFVNALRHGKGPDTFVWSMPASSLKKMSPYALEHSRRQEAFVDSLRVSRDPMTCCGVRSDMHDQYGCGRVL